MNWPKQKDCDAFYGNPRGRNGQPSAKWEAENLVKIIPPYQMFYDGKPIKSFRMHKKCAEATLKALSAINDIIKNNKSFASQSGANVFGGSYNFRLMRNGTRLSMHSWGCAIDLDPARNGLGDTTPRFAGYPQIIKAFEDQGATWGGRWTGSSCDGMHFQFADV